MNDYQFGNYIYTLRTRAGLSQSELAAEIGVSNKAVSKWERDISCPDVTSLPKLAEVLGITLDELMAGKSISPQKLDIVDLACIAVTFAMGVAFLILSALSKLNLVLEPVKTEDLVVMLGLGLTAATFSKLRKFGR